MTAEPGWLALARTLTGVREVPGPGNSPLISGWLAKLGAWWRDDATPWCGVFVGHMMQETGHVLPKHWYRAKGWLDWGVPLKAPSVGAVVVFERQGGGHVGFVVGKDTRGRLLVLGGNQGDAVSIAAFDMARVVGYRWPTEYSAPAGGLPTYETGAAVSKDEA